jgi:hypothetical protein
LTADLSEPKQRRELVEHLLVLTEELVASTLLRLQL